MAPTGEHGDQALDSRRGAERGRLLACLHKAAQRAHFAVGAWCVPASTRAPSPGRAPDAVQHRERHVCGLREAEGERQAVFARLCIDECRRGDAAVNRLEIETTGAAGGMDGAGVVVVTAAGVGDGASAS